MKYLLLFLLLVITPQVGVVSAKPHPRPKMQDGHAQRTRSWYHRRYARIERTRDSRWRHFVAPTNRR